MELSAAELLLILSALYRQREDKPSAELTQLINKLEKEYEES